MKPSKLKKHIKLFIHEYLVSTLLSLVVFLITGGSIYTLDFNKFYNLENIATDVFAKNSIARRTIWKKLKMLSK